MFEGAKKTMMLEEEKIESILAKLKEWSRARRGIPFLEFHKNISRVQHASKCIPVVKALFTPINKVLGIRPEPKLVFIRPNSELQKSIEGFPVLLRKAHKEPTMCKQLVTGDPHFVDIMYAANEGMGGMIVGKGDACVPIVFHLEWPRDIQDMVYMQENPDRPIANSDLEFVGLLICWLVMEEVSPCLSQKHVGIYCSNLAAVSWLKKMETQSSKVAVPLLMALAI